MEFEEMKHLRNDKKAIYPIEAVILTLVLVGLVLMISAGVLYVTTVQSQYNKQVHGYIENARWSDDPLAIEQNLTLAVQGMHDMGLTDDKYSAVFSWEQNPSNRMDAQYAQLQIQIDRCKTLEQMNKTDYNYQSTLQSVENYIYDGNGWGDEVANGCYSYVVCAGSTIWPLLIGFIMFCMGIIIFLFMVFTSF